MASGMISEFMSRDDYDYTCPFDFMTDFDRWFELWKRVIFDGQTAFAAMKAMGVSDEVIDSHRCWVGTARVVGRKPMSVCWVYYNA